MHVIKHSVLLKSSLEKCTTKEDALRFNLDAILHSASFIVPTCFVLTYCVLLQIAEPPGKHWSLVDLRGRLPQLPPHVPVGLPRD